MTARVVGAVVVLATLLILTSLATGFDDGSAAARWCVQHDAAVTAEWMSGAYQKVTYGEVCLQMYERSR